MKKSITIIIICFTVVCSIFQSGCEEDGPNCPDIKDLNIGKLTLSDTIKTYTAALKGKKRVIFKDSLGKEVVFTIKDTSYFEHIEYPEASPATNCPNPLLIYDRENINFSFINSKLNYSLEIENVIFLHDRNDSKEENAYFGLKKIPNGYSQDEVNIYVSNKYIKQSWKSYTLFGKIYSNVLYLKNIGFYLNRDVGILAFHDPDKKFWIFDRFE